MTTETVEQAQKRPPLYLEAMAYCREYDLPPEDFERVRTMLAVIEFRRRVEPYQKQAAKLMALEPVRWIASEGNIRADISPAMDATIKQIQRLIDAEAEALGLVVPARP